MLRGKGGGFSGATRRALAATIGRMFRLMVVLVTLIPLTALAEEPGLEEGGRLVAVQEKQFNPAHEFHISAGWLPQDAFWKGYTLDASYRYHFSDVFALEVFRFALSRNVDTDLKKQLLEEFPAPFEADPFEEVDFMLTSHAILKPFYGKSAFFNRGVVRQELYFLAGGGAIRWSIDDDVTGIRPTFDFGLGLRYWISRRVSVRLEALENLFVDADGSVDDMIYLSLGVTISTFKK